MLLSTMTAMTVFFSTPAAADDTGWQNAGTGSNVEGVGTIAWQNPNNIQETGTPSAKVKLNISQISNYLQGTNYDFSIPSGATIDGIEVEIRRQGSIAGIKDNIVSLVKGGSVVGKNKATDDDWSNSLENVNYGGSDDLWGETWTADEINDENFGLVVSVKSNVTEEKIIYVLHMQITVYYTIGPVTNIDTGKHFDTIQEAIDAAETLDGHTIVVSDGI